MRPTIIQAPRPTPLPGAPAPEPPLPQPLGLARSFGFDDELGAAAPGHIAAARRFPLAPMLAQTTLRQLVRLQRAPESVILRTAAALTAASWHQAWGANADAVRTETDLERMAAAGFCTFTFDLSAHLEERADLLPPGALCEAVAVLEKEAVLPPDWRRLYLGRSFEPGPGGELAFDDASLQRAAVKLGRAIAHAQRMARHLARTAPSDRREFEILLAPAATPLTLLEHLFCALELKRRGIRPVCLTLRILPAWTDHGVLEGGSAALESVLRPHAAVARTFGPYKLGFSHADEKTEALPVVGRLCGELVHVRTESQSYLEALRVAARVAPGLLQEIATFARARYGTDTPSARPGEVCLRMDRALRTARTRGPEKALLENVAARQVLRATAASTLAAGTTAQGQLFRLALLELLETQASLYRGLLDAAFTRHLTLLNAG